MVETGLDRLATGDPALRKLLRGRRVGLVAHPASVDRNLRHALQVLESIGATPSVLFGPEHGWGGEAQDMIGVAADKQGPVPVHSLYGDSEEDLYPRREWLSDLDVLVVDLQDVGSRYYTFVWTAVCVLRRAAEAGVTTLVLDRPNPLGGLVVEGAVQRQGYQSFVGLCDVSVRHGMTVAEICNMMRAREGMDPQALQVASMRGWTRDMLFEDTLLPWVFPSPNMPTCDTARVYPGGCLLEGTSLSEGRGHTRPFEVFGAPHLDGAQLARAVQAEGVQLRPLSFTPTFHKHGGQLCGGVQVHVTDARAFRPYAFYLRLIQAIRTQVGPAMAWRTEAYEFVKDRPAIDLLTGGPEYRMAVDRGDDLEEVLDRERDGAMVFSQLRRDFLLY